MPPLSPPAPRPRWRDALVLLVVCLIAYFPGLDRHGVTNWQEAQRLVVARDMQAQARRENSWWPYLVPTVYGQPYLAKPPMVYWAQLALAEPLGARVKLWHLRLAVAIAGTLGVLACYLAGLVMLSGPAAPEPGDEASSPDWPRRAALWGALCLATGILYARSSRIGELDIFLVPFVTVAIGAVAAAWRRHRERRSTHWAAILLAAAATTGAIMTKDPGVMVVGLAAYGGIALWSAWTRSPLDTALLRGRGAAPISPAPPTRVTGLLPHCCGGLLGIAAATAAACTVDSPADWAGAALVGLAGVSVGATLGRLLQPARLRALLVALSRTHPLIVMGVPIAVRLGWAYAVAQRVGAERVADIARAETEDNVRLFVAAAPLNNLEALAYGCGLGSAMAAFALIWLARDRPWFRPGWAQLLAWVCLGVLAFSVLGKGVPRYLTPLWPGVALLGGMGIATLLARVREAAWPRAALGTIVVLLAIGQGAWYGYGREARSADRSPEALVAELRSRGRIPKRVYSLEFTTPALDYYTGRRVRPLGDPRALAGMTPTRPWTLAELRRSLGKRGGVGVVFARLKPGPGIDDPRSVEERLGEAGLIAERLPLASPFTIDKGRSPVGVFAVRAAPSAGGATRP